MAAEKGIIRLNFTAVEPAKVVTLAVQPLESQMADKQINLQMQMDAKAPKVSIDLEKVAWVLLSLLSSALRYSPRWSDIIVKVESKGGEVIFSVKDSGPGISPDNVGKVFQSLIQNGSISSTGLGLSLIISREIIEAHGGRIWVESELGEGSVFHFSLPVQK